MTRQEYTRETAVPAVPYPAKEVREQADKALRRVAVLAPTTPPGWSVHTVDADQVLVSTRPLLIGQPPLAHARPDLSTLRQAPWWPGSAVVLADATDSRGRLLEHTPRQMLRRQADRLSVLGLTLRIAVETRLQLTWARSSEPGGRDAGDEPAAPILEEFLVNASSQLLQAGLPVEILAKTGRELRQNPQQISVTFRPAEIMAACDAVVLAREAITVLAHNAGLTVSPAQQPGHDVTTLRLRLAQAPDNRLEVVGTPPEPHSDAVVTRTAHAALVEGLPELALVCSLAGRSGTSARQNRHVLLQSLAEERGLNATVDIELPTPDSPHAVVAAIAAVIAYGLEARPPAVRLPALQSMPLPDTALMAYDLLGSSQRARTILGSLTVDHFVRATFP